jgi:uncharacterized damage-inducible protein DinB
MPDIDDHGRPEPPLTADESDTLQGFLDFQRATFAWKCAGLDAAGLAATVGVSSMTLGGMLKHLALVENYWFTQFLHDQKAGQPWDGVDWDADADWDWNSAAHDSPDDLRWLWQDSVDVARTQTAKALESGGLDQVAKHTWSDGRTPSLRWILCHMIEEYGRHNGHADLIRESVDGETGE